jgi:hypothetical protein
MFVIVGEGWMLDAKRQQEGEQAMEYSEVDVN